MKSRHMLIAAGLICSTGIGVCLGGNRPQPAAPPIPPSWKQTPQQQQQQQQQNQNGQPTSMIYSPDGSNGIGTASGNLNGVPQQSSGSPPPANTGPGLLDNTPPAPDNSKPAPAPAVVTPPPPPDPDVVAASADVNSAMEHLRSTLLKSNADYQAAVADKKAAQADSATVRAKEDSTPEQLFAAATRVLEAGRHIVQIERDAAVTDPDVQDARSRLKTALAAHNANAAATAAAK